MADRPSTGARRFLKLAGMTASVASGYAKTRVKALFQSAEVAERELRRSYSASGGLIAKTLGELKGAAMKVGQMASVASSVLPVELVDALRLLQRSAPPMSFDVISERIEAELGRPPQVLFRRFASQPFASASIGQVHHAELDDGRQVVCKVQYPGVEAAVDSDLGHLKTALRASGLARVSRAALHETFEELAARLHEELDYCREADNLRLLSGLHAARHPFVCTPEVIGERSSERVLTLTFEPGDALESLDALAYTQAERDTLGRNLVTFMLSEIFELAVVHGDPHPGNFAFRHDGTVVVYDFGCIKRLQPKIVRAGADLVLTALDADYAAVDDALLRLGVRNPNGPPVGPEFYKVWRDLLVETFCRGEIVDYGKSSGLREQITRLLPGALKHTRSFQPSRDTIVLNRVLAGHYSNLRALRARVPFLSMLLQHLRGTDSESSE